MTDQLDINDIQWLYKRVDDADFSSPLPNEPFADEVIDYLSALSQSLLKDPHTRLYPDVVTFAFFCRRANLLKLKEQYETTQNTPHTTHNTQHTTHNTPHTTHNTLHITHGLRLGRGLIFHIAPSNVPVNFAYSLVAGLLAGNSNVVRVSQKQFPQVDLLVKHLNQLNDYNVTAQRIAVVRYGHESEANAYFSSICDVRVIWGGDQTIATLRGCPLQPRAFDVCFADRYSVAALNADMLFCQTREDITHLAEGFYNDTYLFDQNACSAPHLILWTGSDEHIETAQNLFWQAVYEVAKQKYQFQEVMAVDKLTALYRQAAAMPLTAESSEDNLLRRVMLQNLPADIDAFRCACGYFSEYKAQSLDELANIVTNKYQTFAYYGYEQSELRDFVLRNRLQGIDRIVPIGKTTDFSLTWDGYDLIKTLSRIIAID